MKIFPTLTYDVKIKKTMEAAISDLHNNTDYSKYLTSNFTKKTFRSQVNKHDFKVISSEIGKGSFCVINGDFKESQGKIIVEINLAFRVLISTFIILITIPLTYNAVTEGTVGNLFSIIILISILRFIILEILIRKLSIRTLKMLTNTMGIIELHKI